MKNSVFANDCFSEMPIPKTISLSLSLDYKSEVGKIKRSASGSASCILSRRSYLHKLCEGESGEPEEQGGNTGWFYFFHPCCLNPEHNKPAVPSIVPMLGICQGLNSFDMSYTGAGDDGDDTNYTFTFRRVILTLGLMLEQKRDNSGALVTAGKFFDRYVASWLFGFMLDDYNCESGRCTGGAVGRDAGSFAAPIDDWLRRPQNMLGRFEAAEAASALGSDMSGDGMRMTLEAA